MNSFEFTLNEQDAGGTFHGQCAELCGVGHNAMHFDVHAMTGGGVRHLARDQDRRGERLAATPAVG